MLVDFLKAWESVKVSRRLRKQWVKTPHCVWWSIWKEQKGRCFEGKERGLVHFVFLFLGLLFFRLTKVYPDSIVSFLDFLEEFFLGVLCDYFLELLGVYLYTS